MRSTATISEPGGWLDLIVPAIALAVMFSLMWWWGCGVSGRLYGTVRCPDAPSATEVE